MNRLLLGIVGGGLLCAGFILGALAMAAESPTRMWVVPKEAIYRLELRPIDASLKENSGKAFFPGQDGGKYSQDDVLRGLLTYMFPEAPAPAQVQQMRKK